MGKAELALAGPALVSLGQLGPVVKDRPGQGQVGPGTGSASKNTQPKPDGACLGQQLAGPVRSGPYQILTFPGCGCATPGQVTARQCKNKLAMANPDWTSLTQLR